jgi:hypothetical protein
VITDEEPFVRRHRVSKRVRRRFVVRRPVRELQQLPLSGRLVNRAICLVPSGNSDGSLVCSSATAGDASKTAVPAIMFRRRMPLP